METCKCQVGDLLWVKDRLFMPKAEVKIWLEVTGVRYERLQDITEADALAEGIERMGDDGETVYGTYERKRGKVQRTGWHSDPRHSLRSRSGRWSGMSLRTCTVAHRRSMYPLPASTVGSRLK